MSQHNLSVPLAEAMRAVVAQLQAHPSLWGREHLGQLLRQQLPTPAHVVILEARDSLDVSGNGSLKDWSAGLTVEEAVKELKRILGDT